MKISTILSFIIPFIMVAIYLYGEETTQFIIAIIGSVSTGAGLSILYGFIYER